MARPEVRGRGVVASTTTGTFPLGTQGKKRKKERFLDSKKDISTADPS